MNIACDIRVFLAGETGVGTYYKNLLGQLAAIDRQNRYLLFSSSRKVRFPSAKVPGFMNYRLLDAHIPVKVLNWLWHNWQYPPLEFFFREKIAVAHSPTPMLLPCRGKGLVTICDLFFVSQPQLVQPASRRHFRAQLQKNVSQADGIICISQATRCQLLEMFPGAETKTRVIHLGVAPFFFENSGQPGQVHKKYLLPEKYILFTGTIEPRKNLPTLLRALLKLKQSGISVPLVIAGGRGWGVNEFVSLKKELAGQVHETGYVADADLPALYRQAQLFVFPSLAEGFGLPLLESLACGTPVLCSDIPVFHEIGNGLPTYFKSTDVSDLADKIKELWQQNKEIDREKRIAQARSFSWQNTAARTLDFYRDIDQGQT